MKAIAALAGCALLLGASSTRPYYAPKGEMIARSQAIAVVDVWRVRRVLARGREWTYAQAANAVVRQVVKGELPRHVRLYAQENFVCTRIDFAPGRYLVFLRRDGRLLAGSNWYLSARPVRDGMVEWYANDTDRGDHPSRIRLRSTPLGFVLADVRAHLATPGRGRRATR